MNLKGLKSEIQTTLRGYKLLYKIDRDRIIYAVARAVVAAAMPYSTLYLTSRLISGLSEGLGWSRLMIYAALIVVITMFMSVLSAFVSRKVTVAHQNIWAETEMYFNSVNMKMQYQRLEDAQTHSKADRIFQAQNSNGYGIPLLAWQLELLIGSAVEVVLSVALTVSLFTLRAPGEYSGLWKFVNSPYSALIIVALLLLNIFTSNKLTEKSSQVFYNEIKNFTDENRMAFFFINMPDNGDSAAEIRIYNEASLIQDIYLDSVLHPVYIRNIEKAEARFTKMRTCVGFVMNFVLYLFIAARVYSGAFGIGNFVLYTGTVSRFVSGVTGLFGVFSQLKNNNVYLRDIFEYIDEPNTMYMGTLPVEKRAFCEGGDKSYDIEFRDVSFKYPGSDDYALRHVSLRLRVGERLAVVGMNGSGKTTFIKLLCRLYDPTEGQILLNGVDIKKYDYEEYMSLFSVVFQDFQLFAFSLGQNVAAGEDYDAARVSACLKEAGFGERLSKMEQGLDTCLYRNFDEKGVEISGGEAQKIALARALYKDAPFIILDEPTAALDPVAEYEVYSKFNEIINDKTAVYISHRLSSCRFCDDIAVFDKGRVVQRGSHEELLGDADGKYCELWFAQAQYYN